MKISKTVCLFSLVGLLTACKSTAPILATTSFSFPEALAEFFVSDFSAFEADALALRTTNPRYTIQDFSWSFGGTSPVHDSYSLAHAHTEYAHAAGLTGAGQVISIVDSGFLTTHDEFAGKSISTPGGAADPGIADHGTGVASVAAGISDGGEMIGVAPGADLALGSFDTLSSMSAATSQAISLGAIVQNNSWGYEVDISQNNYNLLFSSAAGNQYMTALTNLADNAVIVFASSNDEARSNAVVMAALPSILPGLEQSWIATVNAVPVISGGNIVAASRISSACLQSAAWCMAADGTLYAAVSSGPSDYQLATGTSFAAPQVSGAVALLAEAFPSLSAQEIRARLLASADNGFFDHTGFVEFAPGIQHGFDREFGHGFLDLRAALLPIGGAYVPTTSGSFALDGPVVDSGGMVGDALSAGLAKYDIVVVDGLGGEFSTPADVLTADAGARLDANAVLAELLSDGPADLFHPNPAFSPFVSGQEISVDYDDNRFSLLLPGDAGNSASYGVALSSRMHIAGSEISLGLSAMHEGDGFVGMRAVSPGSSLSGDHAAATFDWSVPVRTGQELRLSGSIGVAMPRGSLPAMSMQPVRFNSLNLSYGARNVWGAGDRFSVAVGLPQTVQSGSVQVVMPVAMSASGAEFESFDLSLAPDARQTDISVAYGLPLSRRSEIVMSATHSLNDGNISGRSNSMATIGFRFEF